MPYKDKEKQLKAQREWYYRNKDKKDFWYKKRIDKIRAWYKEYKSKLKCENCPENDSRCLDFHHVRGKKNKCVSIMISEGYSIKRILKEIKKCQVLCANCHRKETLDR